MKRITALLLAIGALAAYGATIAQPQPAKVKAVSWKDSATLAGPSVSWRD